MSNQQDGSLAPAIAAKLIELEYEADSMVMLFVKAAIAIVPAVMIAAFFWVVFAGIFSGIFQ